MSYKSVIHQMPVRCCQRVPVCRNGTGEYTQVPGRSRSPATDRVSPRCATDGVVQAMSNTAGVRQTNGAVDTEATLHRVFRHVQLPRRERN